ncbi:transcriptional regulator with XRE-family HTH domain [Novosphingobium capsulatum]|uniref:Transcriptional regulator with XRE-family HTH domain n=1 Tax=Novosphingobium capsulatum TaxID=13688 RepID=A0ABU1MN93_9SPHN|nr:helix-turn-helix domain-containing protein [Novosphingobium capsulatum]MDR6511502.1 transcriptional regulator with XRE-family HTH domain [Novosphingobium capsulatum]
MNEIVHMDACRLDQSNLSSWIASIYPKTGVTWDNRRMSADFDFTPIQQALARAIKAKGIAPTTLSLKVGKSRTLVKNILEDGQDIKVSTLHRLATALDIDLGELLSAEPKPTAAFSAEALEPLLDALIPLTPPSGRLTEQSRKALAEALAYGLSLLEGDSTSPANEGAVAVAARAATSRFREIMN